MADLTAEVLRRFGVHAEPVLLPGGSRATFRAGDVVLKHVGERSLENDGSPQLAAWVARFSATLPQDGFRVTRGIPTTEGAWITPEGWTAWAFVEGRHATASDVDACVEAVGRLHHALRDVPKHELLDASETPWARAHRWCLGEPPARVSPVVEPYVRALYARRRPVVCAPDQVVHGDLNPGNVLVAPGAAPAFIDVTPFWGPPELALAIFATFVGPRQGDAAVLRRFAAVPGFDQMLVRAGLRMLLVMSEIDRLEGWESSAEKRAAEIILEHVAGRA